MKRTIEVKEKSLINKLNDRVKAMDRGDVDALLQDYWVGVDVASEPDRGVVMRWDNNGPVQFEEEDTKTTIVTQEPETESECHVYQPARDPKTGRFVKAKTKEEYVQPLCEAYLNLDNEEAFRKWDEEERPVAMPEGEVTINLDPTKNMTEEEKINFNACGPCDIKEVGGDYKEDEDSLTRAEKDKRYTNFMTNLKKACGKNIDTRMRPLPRLQDLMKEEDYEEVNHPSHYNNYDVEVIDMMEKVFGREATITFCKLNAFKYRMRAGTKPGQSADKDLNKERWYLNKKKELEKKL